MFVLVFLSFSVSVTLCYHGYSQKSALTSHHRHIHITKTCDLLNRLKRILKSYFFKEAPPPIFSAKLPCYNRLHLPPGKVCQYLHLGKKTNKKRHQCGAAMKSAISLPMDI